MGIFARRAVSFLPTRWFTGTLLLIIGDSEAVPTASAVDSLPPRVDSKSCELIPSFPILHPMSDANSSAPRTMLEKIWDQHVVHAPEQGPSILYIDLHLVHEVTSPQAFEGLRINGRPIRRPERTIATPDHNVPTSDRSLPIADPISRKQIETLRENCREFGVTLFDIDDVRQGIVHVIGPENGYTQPGMTIVCGDSHTATHGAFGALAFGIGTSEVEHVLATQTLRQFKPKTFELRVDGELAPGVTAKDMVLYLIGHLGTAGGTGYVLEYTGDCIQALSMEERMTVCNM